MDLSILPQVTQAAPRVVHHVANCKPLIKHGFTWASIYWPIISHSVAAAVGGGLAWYYRGRGLKTPAPTPTSAQTPTPIQFPIPEVPHVPVV